MLTSFQMRVIEADAIEAGRVTGAELMERAGAGVVSAMMERWPGWNGRGNPCEGQIVMVLCGPGNNGGDGYVIARLLSENGARCHVFALGDQVKLPPDAARAHDLWTGPVAEFEAGAMMRVAEEAAAKGQGCLVIVDALFGIGQRAPLDKVTEEVGKLTDHMADLGSVTPWFVAVDLPTGYDADTGALLAHRPVPADLTVTFHAAKPIHGMPFFLDKELVVHDIGL
jgi:hydroxyethylthiazole kinase-like uncharacterized protein yjeF